MAFAVARSPRFSARLWRASATSTRSPSVIARRREDLDRAVAVADADAVELRRHGDAPQRAARRVAEPRPQAPHVLRIAERLGDAPSYENAQRVARVGRRRRRDEAAQRRGVAQSRVQQREHAARRAGRRIELQRARERFAPRDSPRRAGRRSRRRCTSSRRARTTRRRGPARRAPPRATRREFPRRTTAADIAARRTRAGTRGPRAGATLAAPTRSPRRGRAARRSSPCRPTSPVRAPRARSSALRPAPARRREARGCSR